MERSISKKVLTTAIHVLLLLSFSGCVLVTEPIALFTDTPMPDDFIIPNTATSEKTADTATTIPSETAVVETSTPIGTNTPQPTKTFTPLPTKTFTAVPTRTPYPYALQAGSPVYIENFAYPEAGCDWIGVAGQVFGKGGQPQANLVIVVKGWYGGVKNEIVAVTGTVAGDIYGPGGYEAVVGGAPKATQKTLSIQVFDLDGNALTKITQFDTYDACDKNLIIINFSQ